MGRSKSKQHAAQMPAGGPPPAARRNRWPLVLALVVLGAAIAAGLRVSRRQGAAGLPPAEDPLNVLLVTLDTTRADRLGCYGYAGARTPRLDRLAAEGVRFDKAFADAPITLPSHASLMTGLHPFEHGVRNNGNFSLPDRFETLATVLHGQGYRTAAFVSSFVLDRRYGLARGFEAYDDRTDDPEGPGRNPEAERRGDRTAQACSRWLDAYAKQGTKTPFFLWLHLYDPHEPYAPPPPFREAFAGRPYDGEVAFADATVGSVLDHLKSLGLLDRSLVAVVADHGESLGDHGEETHSMFVYEGAIRVPLLLWRPGRLPVGTVVATPVRTVDVAPTILDVLGAPPLAAPGARSLKGAIAGRNEPAPAIYAETYVPKLYMNGAALRALRTERYKLIEAPRPELYDLARDPGETDNRFAADADTAARLHAELRRLTQGGDTVMSVAPVDGEAAEKLRALGYLGAAGDLGGASAGGPEKDPKDLIAAFNRLRRAERAVRDRRFQEALPDLRSLVAEDPRSAFARLVLGSAYMGMREYARAAEELEAYTRLVPTSAHGHQSLAVAWANLGDPARALREAASALALDPRLTDSRLLRAGLLAGQGRRAEAIEELSAGVAATPDQPMLRMSLGELLLDAGRAKDAESEYREILDHQQPAAPGPAALLAEARFGLAVSLERQGRAADARAEYERVAAAPDAPADVRGAARKRLGLAPG
jgi:arylsulfatase A-like enzyme/Tfp pilus assembly protein PilF